MPSDDPQPEVAQLLELAMADPASAQTRARAMLDASQDVWWQSVARHALGLALRESGAGSRAVQELRLAVRLAERSHDCDRTADVRATLGATLVTRGRTREGLVQLERAATDARDPDLTAKVLMRRAAVLSALLGRHDEGVVDLRRAIESFEASGNRVWEARTRNILGLRHLAVGDVGAAEAELRSARDHFEDLGYGDEAVVAAHNLGILAFANGDLPTALAAYDRAAELYSAPDRDSAFRTMDRSSALLAAGLVDEAIAVVDAELARAVGLPILRPELQLRLASALLAAGRPAEAHQQARAALIAFRRTGRDWYAAHAELVTLRAHHDSGRVDRRLVAAATRVAEALERQRSDDAAVAWLLAGRLAVRLDPQRAPELLTRVAKHRAHRAALVRATGWLGHGLERQLARDRRSVARACRHGLDALDLHRATMGSSELRALATAHGEELAQLALGQAVEGRPRDLLWWSERWRATALAQPPVRPDADDETSAALVALRDNGRRLTEARREGADVAQLEGERARWEDAVRRRLRRTAGVRDEPGAEIDVAGLVDAVGDAALVEFVEVGGHLNAVFVHGGRVRKLSLGTSADASRAVDFARFALRRAAAGRPAQLSEAGARLQSALLGRAADEMADLPAVVVSATSRLHAAPWALLPALSDVPLSVVPSAGLWLRARARRTPSARRVFVSGPHLTTGGAEIDVVAPRHPGSTVLRDGAATVERTLAALDGAGLAHIAAHGHFREDSPLFSALDLHDGPLTVHDFERMTRPPHRVVLSACNSGVMAPVGAGELLGLVSALLSVGTAGVAASVGVVNDDATVALMLDLHAALEDGADLATALLHARRSARGDPVREATAASFLALGV